MDIKQAVELGADVADAQFKETMGHVSKLGQEELDKLAISAEIALKGLSKAFMAEFAYSTKHAKTVSEESRSALCQKCAAFFMLSGMLQNLPPIEKITLFVLLGKVTPLVELILRKDILLSELLKMTNTQEKN